MSDSHNCTFNIVRSLTYFFTRMVAILFRSSLTRKLSQDNDDAIKAWKASWSLVTCCNCIAIPT